LGTTTDLEYVVEDVILEAEDLIDVVPILELLVREKLQHASYSVDVLQQLGLILQHQHHPVTQSGLQHHW
jgi:hypothetical protein